MLDLVFIVWAAFLGAVVGSFLNVCVWRLVSGQSVFGSRSHCLECGETIAWYDNIPILSWLFLRARCRYCRGSISWLYPTIELMTLVIWVGMAVFFGPTPHGLVGAILFTLMLAIAVTDALHYLIPDQLSVGGLAAGLAASFFAGPPTPLVSLLGALLGFGTLFAVGSFVEYIFKKPAIGGGDMKMMAMVGAFIGPFGVLMTIFVGAVAGSIVYGPISLKSGKLIPFGVFLALGGALTFLFGDYGIDWYVKFST